MIDVDRGRVGLREASWWDVTGGVRRPRIYRVPLTGPSETESRRVSSEGVVHCLYSTSEQQPRRGVSPMGWSPTTTRLVERLERGLADEAGTPTGQLLALPEGASRPRDRAHGRRDQTRRRNLRPDVRPSGGWLAGGLGVRADGTREQDPLADHNPTI